jgi:hypothetical protein
MFDSPPPDIRLEKILEIYNMVDDTLKDCLMDQAKILLKIPKEKIDPNNLNYKSSMGNNSIK